jgi:peptide/nickel transport system permease protein
MSERRELASAAPVGLVSAARKARSFLSLLRNPNSLTGIAIVTLFILLALLAPVLAPFDYQTMQTQQALTGPSGVHYLGTDQYGRDIFSRVLFGARATLSVAAGAVLLAIALGVPLGMLSGYFGGWVDALSMRVMDVLLSFPALLLALTVVAVLGQFTANVIIAIGLVYVPQFARIARAAVLDVRSLEFVEAGRALGAGHARIISLHVLPNSIAPLLVQATLALSLAVLYESALSFLGMGTQPPTPSWGHMLSEGRRFMELAPWIAIAPGFSIMLLVLGLNLVGDGLRDMLDPRARHLASRPGH